MSRERIEEMANEICDHNRKGICTFDGNRCDLICTRGDIIKRIYNAGYRKQIVGEWKKLYDKAPRYVCTACNHLFNNKEYKHCPNCGARMKGGE